jgi:universal stress protein A
MLSPRSILVPIDFDDNSVSVLEFARRVAFDSEAIVHVLHVMPLFLVPGEPQSAVSGQMGEAQASVEKLAAEHLKGINYQISVRTGDTVREILTVARSGHFDLIVMPTHGRHGLSHFILGSVAERVLRDAPCPVLSFKPGEATSREVFVADVMLKTPQTVSAGSRLSEARMVMDETGLRSVPVIDDGRLVGIITDRDLRSHNQGETLVKEAMTRSPVCTTPGMTVREAAHLLVRLKVGALPVMEDGKLLGMVSTDDVIGKLVERQS